MASTSATASSYSNQPAWPPESNPPVGYLSRKALPIKRNDAEPLTREDVQYDLLHYIFSDKTAAFTSTVAGRASRICFSELYINALYSSAKCSKVLKDKMIDTPAFATELAKFSLLTNVGRINTTMAFFPEMKTALRTYHPVPSLQKTDGNAQDAPRIKNCLKAALLPSEIRTIPPSTPEEILAKRQAGQRPPTSVVNLIFVLSNHAAPLAATHFDGSLNFLDLFLPRKGLSSADRSKVFLWFIFHYLEDSEGSNPWDDEFSKTNRPRVPQMRHVTEADQNRENVDTKEEIEWGRKMTTQRNLFLQRLVASVEAEKKPKNLALSHFVPARETVPPSTQQHREAPLKDDNFMYYVPSPNREQDPPSPPTHPPIAVMPMVEPRRYSYPEPLFPGGERTMLEQAWHVVNTKDPLADSDDGELTDDRVRLDYRRRLDVIDRMLNGSDLPMERTQQRSSQQQQTQKQRRRLHSKRHSHPQPRRHEQPQRERSGQQRRHKLEQGHLDSEFEDLPFHSPALHPHHSHHRSTPRYFPPWYDHAQHQRPHSEMGLPVPPLAVRTNSSNNSSGPMSSVSPSIQHVTHSPQGAATQK